MNRLYPHGDMIPSCRAAYSAVSIEGNWRGLQSLASWDREGPYKVYGTHQDAYEALLREDTPMTGNDKPWTVKRTDAGRLTIIDNATGDVIYNSDPPGSCPLSPEHAKQIEQAMRVYREQAT